MNDLTTGIFDCDTHCYETRDAFTKYMPKDLLARSVFPVKLPDGTETILADRRVAVFNSEQGLGFDRAYRPGSLKEMLKQMASGNPDESYEPIPMRPEFQERAARVALLEEQHVDRAVLYPSTMSLSVEQYVIDTPIAYANIHSFNRWFDETWDFDGEHVVPTALMSLRDLERSVAELEHVLERGARVVLFPTGPANGRSPGDPYFDPIWARMEEAGAVIAFHIMEHWYNEHLAPAWGHDPVPAPWHMSAWQWQNTYGERPIEDTLSALIFDNLFGRFPNLMVLVSEFGASWVPHFVQHMDKSRGMGRNGPWIGGPLRERPSDVFRAHVRVAPYPEDDVVKIVADLGHADSIVMGSDYPHAEGLARPADFSQLLVDLSVEDQHKIIRGNAEALLGAR